MSYHPEPDSHSRNKIKVELDFFNCLGKSYVEKEQMWIHENLIILLINTIDAIDTYELVKKKLQHKNIYVTTNDFNELTKRKFNDVLRHKISD